jgi:hypothetical protein
MNAVITRVVTTLNDSGPGSLREAMMASVSGDAITFAPGLAGVISLASNLPGIRGDLTITGDTSQSITINGNNTNRIFSTGPGVVAISGLSLVRGGGGFGRAIENYGSTVLVENCSVGNCTGNFLLFNSGTMRIKNSRISNNNGQIYTQGLMTFNNSTISDNASSPGGLIYNGGTLAITNSTLSRNRASGGNGGAIYNGGTLILSALGRKFGDVFIFQVARANCGFWPSLFSNAWRSVRVNFHSKGLAARSYKS